MFWLRDLSIRCIPALPPAWYLRIWNANTNARFVLRPGEAAWTSVGRRVIESGKAERLTTRDIRRMRQRGEPIAMLTAYDFVMAALVDQAGIDIVLVGDSLANVILGHETTVPATLSDMIVHCEAVVRGTERSLVVCDMPFGTYFDIPLAQRNAAHILRETQCQAVKLEGGSRIAPIVRSLTENGIAVIGHIGLTPQSVHQLGGYYQHGKTDDEARRLKDDAISLQEAGAFAIVLECVGASVAAEITNSLSIPTIGIGSGQQVSGQVLVVNDLLGLSVRSAPSFARPRMDMAKLVREAVAGYVAEVKASVESEVEPQ